MIQLLYLMLVLLGCNHLVSSQDGLSSCNKTFHCNNNGLTFSYPFWSLSDHNNSARYCGYLGFGVRCSNGNPVLTVVDRDYWIISIDYSHRTLTVVDRDLTTKGCGAGGNFSLPDNPNGILNGPETKTIKFFKNCSSYPTTASNFSCLDSDGSKLTYFLEQKAATNHHSDKNTCKDFLSIPVLNTSNVTIYASPWVFQEEFQLRWTSQCTSCESSGGYCGQDEYYYQLYNLCICPSGTMFDSCVDDTGYYYYGNTGYVKRKVMIGYVKRKVMIGVFTGFGSLDLLGIFIFAYRRRFSSRFQRICKCMKNGRNNTNVETFLKTYGPLALHRYMYSDLRKITNSFKDKLGQGGYGGVFKGKLKDGRFVAVKVLNESKGNGEEFINEVGTIGRTNHVNIVSLIGFCSEGVKRALVYEFMPNGSLEKFIFDEKSTSETHPLGWEKLYQIALGIANGLEYLHRGCSTRILHFDIKPHNILLDNDFNPKISDFGLAKLCLTREDVVSMLNARGTVGYIAPEVYQRDLGSVSSKSDVYSYGMMLLEMVGGRKNIDVTADNTSEIYFPHWIYNHLEHQEENRFEGLKEKFNEESVKKMIMVGLWCIQMHPPSRPSMSMVVEMLQKSVDELPMPPNPFLDPRTSSTGPT